MKKVSIIGNFAFGKPSFNGQTIKTRIVASELERIFGTGNVRKVDTDGGISVVLRLVVQLLACLWGSRNVIILPAQNGIKVVLPLLVVYNLLFRRKLHYVVIGGWLPEMLRSKRWLLPFAKRLHMIYPETAGMKASLHELGLKHVEVMPNCKPLHILNADNLQGYNQHPMRFCIFSRIVRTKGIEDAVEAVRKANEMAGSTIATLDIYGSVDEKQWFERLQASFPSYVAYKGCVAFDKSVDTLKTYTALLFPTFYPGEGLAGTVIDAFAAGIPVFASDWHDNASIVRDGVTGYIFPVHATDRLASILTSLYANQDVLVPMKLHCIDEAKVFLPENAIKILAAEIV